MSLNYAELSGMQAVEPFGFPVTIGSLVHVMYDGVPTWIPPASGISARATLLNRMSAAPNGGNGISSERDTPILGNENSGGGGLCEWLLP